MTLPQRGSSDYCLALAALALSATHLVVELVVVAVAIKMTVEAPAR